MVACHDDAGSRRLADTARAAGRTVLTYGHDDGADLRVGEVRSRDLGTRSVFVHERRRARPASSRCPATTTSWTRAPPTSPPSSGCGADAGAVLAGLAGFGGARRRFEVRGEVDGVTVVDDYAHNPAKVAAVVGTASEIVHRAGQRVAAGRVPAAPVLAHP